MTTQQPTPAPPKRGIIKQILSGDSVIIRAPSGAPPPEKQINFSSITAPKLARRAAESGETTKDEPWAWEAREFLRKKLIGEEVFFTSEKPPNAVREYGVVYLGKDFNTAENITESLVSEGLVTVREAVRPTPEITRLLELQDAAKSAGKGIWSGAPSSDHVRDIKWTIEKSKELVDQLQFKPVKAVIEHVRDGSTVRAFLLPDFYYVTLMLSGIRCPGFKLDANGKRDPNAKVEFAEEARYFVEVRLLQRDVEIVLEAVNNNNFIGTVIHPKGNIAELLLKEGLGKCVDWSIMLMKSNPDKLRAAEKQAKEGRRRLWKDFVPTAPKITGKEKEFSATVSEVNNGDALVLKMANGDSKKIFLASIRAPKEPGRANDDEGKPIPRPKGFRPLYDIPYMFEAREYLRKKLIGKKVHVVVDYIQEARDGFPEKVCATVTVGGKNVAEALVSKGLATVVKYRQDDDQRSCRYDELLTAETKANKSQVGVHSKKDAPPLRVTEIDAARAKLELPALQRAQRIDGIVEFVASGSRLRLYIPKSNSLCTFLLGGINCPRATRQATDTPGEPYGDEALLFTKERCMQREVSIQVDTHDKAGNFIGWLWVDNVNMSVALVKEGFASVHFTGEKSQYASLLKSAEDSAKSEKLRIWKNYVEEEKEEKHEEEKVPVERQVNFEEVVVTEVTPEGSFYIQKISEGPKAEALFAKLRQEFQANPPLPGAFTPKRGDICAAKFTVDDEWYRVKVEKVQGGKASVHYIDYGNKETLPTTRLASLPAAYVSERPFATEYVLPFIVLPKDEEFSSLAIKYLKEDTAVSKLYMNVEYRQPGSPAAASLHSDKTSDADIVKNLVKEGLLIVDNIKGRRNNKLLESYREAQETAKKQHANIWEYGDITEVDAKEFGLGV
ncbi:staphylococcal nuclease domain-containing protein 1 [Diabrotica virgifera virgifera]|uniref:Staphylococcal nuclease domain-containing protein 1 n=1 Tax=Diabrotica virgifera virgifera TaxID=50390 RepID=A0A6P7F6Z2_DIAVI|nr:staphylococcal nuclease domain-containing protein 1 [Diabrotica virgifera virgifera]